jgi:hypothetical protein
MDLSKLRRGELIAGVGGIVLLIALLFLNWYGVGDTVETPFGDFSVGADFGAWDGQGFLGTLANLVILAAGIAAVGLALLTATSRTVALPVAASAMTAGLGIAAVVMVVMRILFQPGPNDIVDLKLGIFVALIGSLAVAYGGWQSMQEEGTTFADARDRFEDRGGTQERPAGGGVEPASPAEPSTAPSSTPPPSAAPPRPGGDEPSHGP